MYNLLQRMISNISHEKIKTHYFSLFTANKLLLQAGKKRANKNKQQNQPTKDQLAGLWL